MLLVFILISIVYSWHFHESCRDKILPYTKIIHYDFVDIIFNIRLPFAQSNPTKNDCYPVLVNNETTLGLIPWVCDIMEGYCKVIPPNCYRIYDDGYTEYCDRMYMIFNYDKIILFNLTKINSIEQFINNTFIKEYVNTIIEKYNNFPLYSIGGISSISLILIMIMIVYQIYLTVIICKLNKKRPIKYHRLQEMEIKMPEVPDY